MKPSTKKYYADIVKDFLNPFFGDMPLAEITRRNMKEPEGDSRPVLEGGPSYGETIFVNEAGRPMDCSKVRRAHEAGLKAAGLRHIRVHELRGTYTSLGVSAGASVYHVSKSLGHSETLRPKGSTRTSPPARRVNCRTFWSDLYGMQRYRIRTRCEQNEKGVRLFCLTP